MTDQEETARALILARLAESREELQHLLDPPRAAEDAGSGSPSGSRHDGFPRSRTMQMLMSGRGMGVLGAAAAGLLLSRPTLALRLLRLFPMGAAGKIILARVVASLRSKDQPPR